MNPAVAPVERADTRDRYSTLPLFYLYQYMYSVGGALPHMTYPLAILYFMHSYQLIYSYTVTRIDVIFRYPDRVPLTHFVHRAKKVFSM